MSQTCAVAYQLSLLGDAPKPGKAWRRSFWQWTLGGLAFPPPPDAERQAVMLTCDSHSFTASAPLSPREPAA